MSKALGFTSDHHHEFARRVEIRDVVGNYVDSTTWVQQEDPAGCGAATLAMILKISYEEAKQQVDALLWEGELKPVNWLVGGCTSYHLDRVLYDHGYFKQTRYAAWGKHLSAFAEIHYAIVQQPSNNHHFVVMLRNGIVLDPMNEGQFAISDWSKVLQVCGLVKR